MRPFTGMPKRNVVFTCVVITATTIAVRAADIAWSKVHDAIVTNIEAQRGIACVQTVEHTRYDKKRKNSTCAELTAAGLEASRGPLMWHDRSRVEVGAGIGGENFRLTSATPFEPADATRLLSPVSIRRSDFVSFLSNVVSGEGEQFQPAAAGQFNFIVPAAKSHWAYGNGSIGYHGSLFTASDSRDLRRMTLAAENVADACSVQLSIDYADTQVGTGSVILPQTSVMDELLSDGTEYHSEAKYSSCQAAPKSVAAPAGNAPASIPAGLDLHVRLQAPIDGATSAAGDAVTAIVKSNVKDGGQVVIHQGDLLHGRIVTLEEYLVSYEQVGAVSAAIDPRWVFAVVFETIERNGVQQPISLTPNDDGDRSPHDAPTTPSRLQQLRPPGGGYYIFYKKTLNLDTKFEMEWTTK